MHPFFPLQAVEGVEAGGHSSRPGSTAAGGSAASFSQEAAAAAAAAAATAAQSGWGLNQGGVGWGGLEGFGWDGAAEFVPPGLGAMPGAMVPGNWVTQELLDSKHDSLLRPPAA